MTKHPIHYQLLLLTALGIAALSAASLLGGCGRTVAQSATAATEPTSTVAALFAGDATTLSAEAGLFDQPSAAHTEPAKLPTPTARPTLVAPERGEQAPRYREIVIYDEALNENWTLANSSQIVYDPWDTSHWFELLDKERQLDTDGFVLAATPTADFSTLYFTLAPTAAVSYPRRDIVGLSLWLNSGGDFMDTDDLALAVIGSNANSYWISADRSAIQGKQNFFSETRLYYLDVNRTIPPDTWVNVTVWLDDLMFDPDYEYVTGFYLKSDVGFQRTYFVDKVTLLAIDDGS